MDEYCAVCADPLEWTGYGPCGHVQTCSKCIARLRFVVKDNRCPICQQESTIVFFTRFNGDYTTKLTNEQFHNLKGGSQYRYLSIINGYFDDVGQFESIKALCSYTHPEANDGTAPIKFRNICDLKAHLKEHFGKQFCEICLLGRKLFVCEQQLYQPGEIKRHMASGDLYGPLAETGFKGHPMCAFCRNRFFSDSELFKHNSEKHETCFICKRDNAQVRTYYRDYPDLEIHFRQKHYLCENERCREARFVVFRTENELAQHTSTEHERRKGRYRGVDVVNETNFQFGRPVRGRDRFHVTLRQEYAGERDDGPVREADGFSEQRVIQLTDADFPSFIDAPVIQKEWPVRGNRLGSRLREEQFPSLTSQPVPMKNPPRNGKTMAARIASSSSKSPLTGSPPPPFSNPNLMTIKNTASAPQLFQETSPEQRFSPPKWPLSKEKAEKSQSRWVTVTKKQENQQELSKSFGSKTGATKLETNFPSLLGETTSQLQAMNVPKWGKSQENKPKPKPPPPKQKPKAPVSLKKSDFPSLGNVGDAENKPSEFGRKQTRFKVSEGLRTANIALVKKVKDQMDSATFQEFHKETDRFLKAEISAEVFHSKLVNYGIVHYASEIASLCPDISRRDDLLIAHSDFIEQFREDASNLPCFVPLSVLESAFQRAMDNPTWICRRCSTINLCDADFCEACDQARSEHQETPSVRERALPVPLVYRRGNQKRTLFGVEDTKRAPNPWNQK